MRPCTRKHISIIRHHLKFFLKIFQLFMNTLSKSFQSILFETVPTIIYHVLTYQLNDGFESVIAAVSGNGLRCIKIEYETVKDLVQFLVDVNKKCW